VTSRKVDGAGAAVAIAAACVCAGRASGGDVVALLLGDGVEAARRCAAEALQAQDAEGVRGRHLVGDGEAAGGAGSRGGGHGRRGWWYLARQISCTSVVCTCLQECKVVYGDRHLSAYIS
jgi:hypothetical protein